MASVGCSFAKGGAYSPYYADLQLVVNWERDGQEMKVWANPLYGTLAGHGLSSCDFYFRPGLTWPRRTQLGLNLRAYPAGAIFADKGPVAFAHQQDLPMYLGLSNSSAFAMVVSLQMAFGSYEVGVVQRTPVPDLSILDGEAFGRTGPIGSSVQAIFGYCQRNQPCFCAACCLAGSWGTR